MYLWRAVDSEGEVLDILVQRRRDKKAALEPMRKLLEKQGFVPTSVGTDKLPSYGAALGDLGLSKRHETGGRKNNRAENSHQPVRRRERRMQGFNPRDQRNVSRPPMPPSTTPSTRSANRSLETRFANFVVKPLSNGGTRPLRHEWQHPTAEGLSGRG